MTLVAIRTDGDRAQVLVDTLAYGPGDADYEHSNKVRTLAHLDTVIIGKGASFPASELYVHVDTYCQLAPDFETMATEAPRFLKQAWEAAPEHERNGRSGVSTTWLVGWSARSGRYVALQYDSRSDFQPREVARGSVLMDPVPPVVPDEPQDDDAWAALGESVYEQCSVALDHRHAQTMIGGGLILTSLSRGRIEQRRLHTLPDDDWRFRQMVIGTVHRYGQIGPCICGSGQPYLICHLPSFDPSWPCPCDHKRERLFVDCHRLTPADPGVFDHWIAHADDFHRTQDELRHAWDQRFPDAPRAQPPQIIKPASTPLPGSTDPYGVLLSRRDRRAAARAAARTPTH